MPHSTNSWNDETFATADVTKNIGHQRSPLSELKSQNRTPNFSHRAQKVGSTKRKMRLLDVAVDREDQNMDNIESERDSEAFCDGEKVASRLFHNSSSDSSPLKMQDDFSFLKVLSDDEQHENNLERKF